MRRSIITGRGEETEEKQGLERFFGEKEGLRGWRGIFAVEKLDAEARHFLCPHGEEIHREPG
jgi:hypothetical protein